MSAKKGKKVWVKGLQEEKKRNYKKASALFEKAAELGFNEALFRLGKVHAQLIGNGAAGTKWYRKCIMKKFKISDSYYQIGKIFYNGIGGIDRNKPEAFKSFDRGTNGACFFMTGKMLIDGFSGQEKNPEKGLECLKKAVDCGEPRAIKLLSELYKTGKNGIEKNEKEASTLSEQYDRIMKEKEEKKGKKKKKKSKKSRSRKSSEIQAPPKSSKKKSKKSSSSKKKSKKKKKKRKEKEIDLSLGTVHFVRLQGFDPWPALVIDAENLDESRDWTEILENRGKGEDVLVEFFNDPTCYWLNSKKPNNKDVEVIPFVVGDFPEFDSKGADRKALDQAIEDAQTYMEENGMIKEEDGRGGKKKKRRKKKAEKKKKRRSSGDEEKDDEEEDDDDDKENEKDRIPKVGKEEKKRKRRIEKQVVPESVVSLWKKAEKEGSAIERNGRIVESEGFHNEDFIFPLRYKILVVHQNVRFSCSIEKSDKNKAPIFKVGRFNDEYKNVQSYRSDSLEKSWEKVTDLKYDGDLRHLFQFDHPRLLEYENAKKYCLKNRKVSGKEEPKKKEEDKEVAIERSSNGKRSFSEAFEKGVEDGRDAKRRKKE